MSTNSHVSSSVSPDSCRSAKASRVLGTQGEKNESQQLQRQGKWNHYICWEAVFRGNIPKSLILFCLFCMWETHSVRCGILLLAKHCWWISKCNTQVRWGRLCQLVRGLVKPLTVQRCRSRAAAPCEVHWSLKCAVAPNKVWISCKAVPGAAQGCVSVMGRLLWELMKF